MDATLNEVTIGPVALSRANTNKRRLAGPGGVNLRIMFKNELEVQQQVEAARKSDTDKHLYSSQLTMLYSS